MKIRVQESIGEDLKTKDYESEDKAPFFRDRAILCPKNVDVDAINAHVLEQLTDEPTTYFSEDKVHDGEGEDLTLWPTDFLNSLSPAGMPPHELMVAPGAVVMLLRNLDVEAGLCNGVRAIILKCGNRILGAKVISGKAAGRRIFIPRIPLAPQNPDLPFRLERRQFPIKLAWAMTINKAQGQTLTRLGLYLPQPVFAHGQLYVALSRSGTMDGVRVLVADQEHESKYKTSDGCVYTLNIVWPEALLSNTAETEDSSVRPPPKPIKSPRLRFNIKKPASTAVSIDESAASEDPFFDESSGANDRAPPAPRNTKQDGGAEHDRNPDFDEDPQEATDGIRPHTAAPPLRTSLPRSIPVRMRLRSTDPRPGNIHLPIDAQPEEKNPQAEPQSPPKSHTEPATASTAASSSHQTVPGSTASSSNTPSRSARAARLQHPRSMVSYPLYFEKQSLVRCGLLALNNALGFALLAPEDMEHAFEVFQNENLIEGNVENPGLHISETGWYSEAVMAAALHVKHNLFQMNLDNPIQNNRNSLHRIFSDDVLGIIVNINNRHWIAFRCVDGQIWKLDSEGKLKPTTFAEYAEFLKKHRNKFAVQQIHAD